MNPQEIDAERIDYGIFMGMILASPRIVFFKLGFSGQNEVEQESKMLWKGRLEIKDTGVDLSIKSKERIRPPAEGNTASHSNKNLPGVKPHSCAVPPSLSPQGKIWPPGLLRPRLEKPGLLGLQGEVILFA